ncbi:histidine phosphatase family protein [Sulfurovum sp.]|uniref:SixA phosphatase family protein n=1 Tax=Sulfurovum sp. TaxID=1969726 RepID=UPI002867B7CA|nr:histidine phosphatase family protein [Sulfurovum sp.]
MIKKTLYIARHAKSSWKDMSLSDFERPLNARGKRDAPFMANLLKEKGIRPELILSSPAKRAKKTAKHYHITLGGELQFDESIYEASSMSLFDLLQEALQKVDSVMIVGHNPELTALNDMLSDKSIFNIPTAGIVGIVFEDKIATHQGKQLFFEYPKKYQQ